MSGTGKNSSKGSTMLPSETSTLALHLDPIILGNQRTSRTGELKRVLRIPLGSTSDGHPSGGDQNTHASLLGSEDLKRFKDSMRDSSKKACDRAKMLCGSISKLDKLMENLSSNLSSKKRQRNDVISSERSGVNLEKMGNQLHARDSWNQRMEQKSKDAGFVKRPRISGADGQADSKLTAPRQPTIKRKREEKFPVGNAVSIRAEEKICRVTAGGEGWERKIKKRRSVSAVGGRVMNDDVDPKQAMGSKMPVDSKLCSADSPGFRSKSFPGVNGVNKLNRRFESPSPSASVVARNDQEAATSPGDHMDMTEKSVLLNGNKSNNRDSELSSGGAGLLIPGKASRVPKTGSVMVLDSSTNVDPSHGATQDFEQPPNANKIADAGVAKEKTQAISSATPARLMTKWGGRLQKGPRRATRSRVINHTEIQNSPQGFAMSGGCRSSIVASSASLHANTSNMNSMKVRNELQKVASPAAVSESEESGALGIGQKEKAVEGCEVVVTASLDTGVSVLPAKNKISRCAIGDGVRRQGRSDRGLLMRSIGPPMRDKPDGLAAKPPQSVRPGSERNKSKSGRPVMKKLKDRKGLPRVASVQDAGPPEFMGEFDDHGTLVAAANSARNAWNQACCNRFWQNMDHFFASVSNEDASYLRKQLSFVEELDETLSLMFGVDCNTSDVRRNKDDTDNFDGRQGNNLGQEAANMSSFCAKFNIGRLCKFPSMFERLVSALIHDESEEVYLQAEVKNLSPHTSDDSHSGSCNQMDIDFKDRDRVESEVESAVEQNQKLCFLDRLSCNKGGVSSTLRNSGISTSGYSNEHSFGDDAYSHLEIGLVSEICSGDTGKLQQKDMHVSAFPFPDEQYQLMSLSDRITLELRSIDLCPETLPDLGEEGELISDDIIELKGKLYQQVTRMRKRLEELNKAIISGEDTEKRKMEEMQMSCLCVMAQKRRMACRVANSTKTSVRRVPNHVAAVFIQQTLARFKKYEETGISCFGDPALQDILSSRSAGKNDAKSVDCVGSGTASNTLNEALKHQAEAKGSGAISSTPEVFNSRGESIANLSSEQDSDKPGSLKVTSAFDIKSTAVSERKMQTKTKQRLKNSSRSSGFAESPETAPVPVTRNSTQPIAVAAAAEVPTEPTKETGEEATDLENMTLDASFLNFDVDGLDCNTAGLEVPPWDEDLFMF